MCSPVLPSRQNIEVGKINLWSPSFCQRTASTMQYLIVFMAGLLLLSAVSGSSLSKSNDEVEGLSGRSVRESGSLEDGESEEYREKRGAVSFAPKVIEPRW